MAIAFIEMENKSRTLALTQHLILTVLHALTATTPTISWLLMHQANHNPQSWLPKMCSRCVHPKFFPGAMHVYGLTLEVAIDDRLNQIPPQRDNDRMRSQHFSVRAPPGR